MPVKPLTGIWDSIDFERIIATLSDLYENNTERRVRPNYNPVLIGRKLSFQQFYNLSDPEVKKERDS